LRLKDSSHNCSCSVKKSCVIDYEKRDNKKS
jgi:hypothetical protein